MFKKHLTILSYKILLNNDVKIGMKYIQDHELRTFMHVSIKIIILCKKKTKGDLQAFSILLVFFNYT